MARATEIAGERMARTASSHSGFVAEERRRQARFFETAVDKAALRPDSAYRLLPAFRDLNLAPEIRDLATAYFGPPRNIAWHRHADHGLSSQIACLNFLMPLSTRPELLGEVIGRALGRRGLRMLPVEGGPHFVGFEWIGAQDYLGEWGKGGTATRGANVTSSDAVVRFEADGRVETLLIEWKYTESYGTAPDPKKQAERIRRYGGKAFFPDGPFRADLGLEVQDLFWEPVYQMVRQQMLAWCMQQAREDGADRVSDLHVSPLGNRALHQVTPPKLQDRGADVFETFRSLLVRPEDFTATSPEQAFGPTLAQHRAEPWAAYLLGRYGFADPDWSAHGEEAA